MDEEQSAKMWKKIFFITLFIFVITLGVQVMNTDFEKLARDKECKSFFDSSKAFSKELNVTGMNNQPVYDCCIPLEIRNYKENTTRVEISCLDPTK